LALSGFERSMQGRVHHPHTDTPTTTLQSLVALIPVLLLLQLLPPPTLPLLQMPEAQ
jgi:hypothetical protein